MMYCIVSPSPTCFGVGEDGTIKIHHKIKGRLFVVNTVDTSNRCTKYGTRYLNTSYRHAV